MWVGLGLAETCVCVCVCVCVRVKEGGSLQIAALVDEGQCHSWRATDGARNVCHVNNQGSQTGWTTI